METHGDFRIAWNSYNPHLSVKGQQITQGDGKVLGYTGVLIPSGDVNFSKLERENPEFQETMSWVRIITTWGLIGIIIHHFYKLILATFGISTELFGESLEEKRQIETQQKEEQRRNEQNWLNEYNKQKYNEWLWRHRKK